MTGMQFHQAVALAGLSLPSLDVLRVGLRKYESKRPDDPRHWSDLRDRFLDSDIEGDVKVFAVAVVVEYPESSISTITEPFTESADIIVFTIFTAKW